MQLKTQVKRSSSEALLKRSAPDTDRNGFKIDSAKIYPELIADLLMNGHKVKFRAPGYSMYPTILNGDTITVKPIKPDSIRVGDIILYQDQKNLIAHRVVKIENRSDCRALSQPSTRGLPRPSGAHSVAKAGSQPYFTLRGDARPACDDPVAAEHILGKVVLIETNGRCINPYCFRIKLTILARRFASCLKFFIKL